MEETPKTWQKVNRPSRKGGKTHQVEKETSESEVGEKPNPVEK